MPPLAIAQRDKQQPRKSLDSGERLHYTERGTLHRRAGRAMSFLRRDGHTEMSAITHLVAGLDALLEHLAAQRIAHEPIETYSNGVRLRDARGAPHPVEPTTPLAGLKDSSAEPAVTDHRATRS